VHGLASSAAFWDEFAERLTDRFEVLAVDLPGHGTSPRVEPGQGHPRLLAQRVAAAVDDYGWARPHVLGISLGGGVALELAAAGAVASATALAPVGLWRRAPKGYLFAGENVLCHALRLAGRRRDLLLRVPLVIPAIAKAQLRHPENLSAAQLQVELTGMGTVTAYREISGAFRREPFIGAADIAVPVAIAFGANDPFVGAVAAQDASQFPPGATVIDFDDCNHGVCIDQPEQTVELLCQTVALAEAAGDPSPELDPA
jgi:pimeloyl-ACP methyl ester carboxylesterase